MAHRIRPFSSFIPRIFPLSSCPIRFFSRASKLDDARWYGICAPSPFLARFFFLPFYPMSASHCFMNGLGFELS